jgi:hypothetical protein
VSQTRSQHAAFGDTRLLTRPRRQIDACLPLLHAALGLPIAVPPFMHLRAPAGCRWTPEYRAETIHLNFPPPGFPLLRSLAFLTAAAAGIISATAILRVSPHHDLASNILFFISFSLAISMSISPFLLRCASVFGRHTRIAANPNGLTLVENALLSPVHLDWYPDQIHNIAALPNPHNPQRATLAITLDSFSSPTALSPTSNTSPNS